MSRLIIKMIGPWFQGDSYCHTHAAICFNNINVTLLFASPDVYGDFKVVKHSLD